MAIMNEMSFSPVAPSTFSGGPPRRVRARHRVVTQPFQVSEVDSTLEHGDDPIEHRNARAMFFHVTDFREM